MRSNRGNYHVGEFIKRLRNLNLRRCWKRFLPKRQTSKWKLKTFTKGFNTNLEWRCLHDKKLCTAPHERNEGRQETHAKTFLRGRRPTPSHHSTKLDFWRLLFWPATSTLGGVSYRSCRESSYLLMRKSWQYLESFFETDTKTLIRRQSNESPVRNNEATLSSIPCNLRQQT